MSIIFLDIDGVLNSEKWFESEEYLASSKYVHKSQIDPSAVNLLLGAIKDTGARIVVSSSWRWYDLESTLDSFKKVEHLSNIVEYIVGVTPGSMSRMRGSEIKQFIDIVNGGQCQKIKFHNIAGSIDSYVILDDDTDMLPEQNDRFIHVDGRVGLTETDCLTIKKLFNKND